MAGWFSGLLDRPFFYSIFHGFVSGPKEWHIRRELQRHSSATVLKVVDMGCGPGTNARLFLEKARFDYLGLDINPDYIRQAAQKYKLAFECADITDGWKPARQFDIVLINSVLHHLTDLQAEAVLSAAARCLTPSGRCLVMDMIRPDTPTIWNAHRRLLIRMDRGEHCRSKTDLENLLMRHFCFSRTEHCDLKPFFIPLWDMRLYVCERK